MSKVINERTFYQVVIDLDTLTEHQTINDFNKSIVIDGEIYTMYKILGVNKKTSSTYGYER